MVAALAFGVIAGFLRGPALLRPERIERLERRRVPGRQHTIRTALVTIIDDAYNANPLSMRLGLDHLFDEGPGPGGRRVAVLGDMVELGPEATAYHAEIGAYARARADFMIGIGELARHYRPDLWFATAEDCAATAQDWLRSGDRVLVKGSHVVPDVSRC